MVDARWDATNSGFARQTLDAANGKHDQPPYSTFYGKEPASTINAFGVRREVAFGELAQGLLEKEAGSPLATVWLPRWQTDTTALDGAAGARDAALRAEAMIDVDARLYVAAINIELDRLEGDLLKIFPGQPRRIAAFLAPTRERRPRRPKKKEGGDE